MAIQAAPRKLIDESGRLAGGIFREPIAELNYLEFRHPGGVKKVSPSRIKRWEYLGFVSQELVLGCAVVSLHLAGNCFFYIFDRKQRKLREFNFITPFCRGLAFESNGVTGRVTFAKGRNRVALENNRAEGWHALEASLDGITARIRFEDKKEPLVCATRVGYAGFNYTLKLAGLPATGELSIDRRAIALEPGAAFGVLDYTTGCLARETFWNWASGGGRDEAGNVVGINFVQGVNETGVTENAFWIGDKLVKVDTLTFDYDDRNILKPWRIRSWDGKVDLTFEPEGERSENVNLGLIASKFHQPFGNFSGTLLDDSGARHKIKQLSGYVEEHFARW